MQSDGWRRCCTKGHSALLLFICFVVLCVHWVTFSHENAKLPIEGVIAELEKLCPTMDDAAMLPERELPPAFYGLSVWADSAAMLPGVHATLALMKERLIGNAALTAVPLPTHSLHTLVRLEPTLRDVMLSALVKEAQEGKTHTPGQIMRALQGLAGQQQLGMPTLKHAFLPEVGQEVEMIGLSLFSVPSILLGNDTSDAVQCFLTDARQGFCVFSVKDAGGEEGDWVSADDGLTERTAYPLFSSASLTSAAYHAREHTFEAELRAAILSVMAQQMGLVSFKPADVLTWKESRELQGCRYAIASLRSSLRVLTANTNMAIPQSAEHLLAEVMRHTRSLSFVRAARAADDLQFHPSLTPQLYIPSDHSLVSQLTILLPMLSTAVLAVRFVVDERRANRRQSAASAAPKESTEPLQ